MIRVYKLMFLMAAFSVNAGNVDLALTTDFVSQNNFYPGEVGEFSLTITNNGPDDAGADSIVPYPVRLSTPNGIPLKSDGMDITFFQNPSIPQDCFLVIAIGEPLPGEDPIIFYSFQHSIIPVNTSVTCYGLFQVFDSTSVIWRVRSPTDTELNDSNNSIEMIFGVQPLKVPTLSVWALFILIVAFLFTSLALPKFLKNN